MRIGLLSIGGPATGFGRYARELWEQSRKIADVDFVHLDSRSKSIYIEAPSGKTRAIRVGNLPEHRYVFYYRAKRRVPNYDAYHVATQNLSFLKVRPRVVTCLDVFRLAYPLGLTSRLVGKLLYSGLKDSDHVIAISRATKHDLVSACGISSHRVSVIYPGVNLTTFRPAEDPPTGYEKWGLSQDNRHLLHVGSETFRKNIDGLLKALYHVKKDSNGQGVKLIKVGASPASRDRRRTKRMVETLGLQSDVVFIDRVDDESLAELYRLADLFVFPSRYEGFGLPVLEAMACGTAVIASDASSLPEVVGDAGMKVNPHSPRDLANAILALLADSTLRKDLAMKGLQRARTFTWESATRRTVKVYGDLVS